MAWHDTAECTAACLAEGATGLCDGNDKGKVVLLRLKQCLKGKLN